MRSASRAQRGDCRCGHDLDRQTGVNQEIEEAVALCGDLLSLHDARVDADVGRAALAVVREVERRHAVNARQRAEDEQLVVGRDQVVGVGLDDVAWDLGEGARVDDAWDAVVGGRDSGRGWSRDACCIVVLWCVGLLVVRVVVETRQHFLLGVKGVYKPPDEAPTASSFCHCAKRGSGCLSRTITSESDAGWGLFSLRFVSIVEV